MFFLLRAAFWIGLVLILIPTGDQQPVDSKLGTGEAVTAAASILADATRFCDRQPEACTVGSQAASYLGQRAQAGAKRVFGMMSDNSTKAEAAAAPAKPRNVISSQNTLSAADRAIPHRNPS
ncbi:hypothetical protein GJW-30_1_03819 [Variibacter gotjawalensis]|uniref:DUF5330 domain-containing protein n=1 Tax=Variibacter gotjawalensis TaxID=1333996 RepID=A0A0S3PZE9_9BRAD|nr:DUF5330 domain-containing protein [Variibacter gotjawalensis]NIK47100.1 hypothetical protein [Variibacter gotjawalensis]RZS49002.1 hypothetical protein EV661_1426 [Variibacter gotjawalensis]BAT61262.1 hypothetical protein GJW-30_1_03819 [Variibacter gotjawalensis]